MAETTPLSFEFRGHQIPVTYPTIDKDTALKAMKSEPFQTWCKRCSVPQGEKQIEIHGVEIQCVDMFGKRVGFVKIKADCTLVDGKTLHKHRLPGICFLRGNAVAILVALHCRDDDKIYSLLVEQPR